MLWFFLTVLCCAVLCCAVLLVLVAAPACICSSAMVPVLCPVGSNVALHKPSKRVLGPSYLGVETPSCGAATSYSLFPAAMLMLALDLCVISCLLHVWLIRLPHSVLRCKVSSLIQSCLAAGLVESLVDSLVESLVHRSGPYRDESHSLQSWSLVTFMSTSPSTALKATRSSADMACSTTDSPQP